MERLHLAVEDRFLIVNLNEGDRLLPEGRVLERIALPVAACAGDLQLICDISELRQLTGDVLDAIDLFSQSGAHVLASLGDRRQLARRLPTSAKIFWLEKRPPAFSWFALNAEDGYTDGSPHFLASNLEATPSEIDEALQAGSFTQQHYKRFQQLLSLTKRNEEGVFPSYTAFRTAWERQAYDGSWWEAAEGSLLASSLGVSREARRNARNSLLVEFTIQVDGGRLTVSPYHCHSTYRIDLREELRRQVADDTEDRQVMVGRPAVIANRVGAIFASELQGFAELLSDSAVKESDIQSFLEQNTSFLHALGYRAAYPQVVLERRDGSSLRPDFILEPVASDWCDILDIKLPSAKLVVGRPNRRRLAQSVAELVAQLREYSAFFEDPALAARVESLYGVRCYRPRLIGLVGRSPGRLGLREFRRLMTAYSDFDLVTFDDLYRIASGRILI